MPYSNLLPISDATMRVYHDRDLVGADPLPEAWVLLQRVRAVAFDANDAARWLKQVRTLAAAAQQAISDHILFAERESSLPKLLASATGATGESARSYLTEHGPLLRDAAEFLALCSIEQLDDVSLVVRVTESAVRLEMAVARHRNRLVWLLDEAARTHRPRARTTAEAAL